MKKNVKTVMEKIIANGFQVYLVGGYVRDYLLNIETADYDLATNAKPADLKIIFPSVELTNYGSVILKYRGSRFEITTFRIEKNYKQNRFPSYEYANTLDEDIKRRDFTMNSMYMDIEENIIDKLNGKIDITNKTIKMVGNPDKKIEEDVLRILRAIRFATIYNFRIDLSLEESIKKYGYLLINLSYARKKEELDKIFANSNIMYGIELIKKYNLDKYLDIKGFDNLKPINNILGIWAQLEVNSKYPFKKSEKSIINKIKLYLTKDILNPHVLYKSGLYIASIVGQIRKISLKKINEAYNDLTIKQRKDIAITSDDIVKALNIKPSKIISNIYDDLAYQIINNDLVNEKDSIIKYILKKYK